MLNLKRKDRDTSESDEAGIEDEMELENNPSGHDTEQEEEMGVDDVNSAPLAPRRLTAASRQTNQVRSPHKNRLILICLVRQC